MAEIVQQRIEDRIPELEQLERVGLFTKKEVKAIIKKVTSLEYKLHRLIINKDDFIAYIQYEINVLELVKKRRAHIRYQFKKEEIEFPIIHRINSVFRRATNKWKDDVQLWLSHVAFCKKWSTQGQLSKVFSAMLAIHPDKPALWIMAAKSELEERNSSESARHLFLRALRFHPGNRKLYQEYFRMELLHCEKLRKQKAELEKAHIDIAGYEFSAEILSGKLAMVVYNDATDKNKDAEFVISLLNIASIFDFTKDFQEAILQDLQTKFLDDSVTWNFLAKRELDAPGVGEALQTVMGRASEVDRREAKCCQVYEKGLERINTEPMWTSYIAFCLERVKRKTNVQQLVDKRQERLLGVLRRAHDSSLLKEDYYKNWLQILVSSGDEESAANIAIAATRRYSQSVSAWSMALQTLVHLGRDDVRRLFHEALANIHPKRGLSSAVPAVAMEMKESYVDWSYTTGGYKKARKTFTSLQENRPLSKTFFTKMIQIEKEQETPKMDNLRDYYERVLQEFGSSDEDLWLEYIQEEMGPLGQPENCGKIHWRAMKFLEGESVERFTSKYTLLQTGHL
ncbi:U3 small nucleolar RNA-associated protein 6 homolog isoform X2 [Hippocampus zosterae]|uniref:U3 small nucleolar RNA-associated protein 6 homolog isoform X2 n=1 Tax=Hippocampus zosterae TaxID=109293 RepID=UPI00223DA204|nr:U3 small nucleolar RNA-associated protein 6 homolog isoform X2 [Hippocampus zosterae]